MKQNTSEWARRLGIHPARLLQHANGLVPNLSFEDVWPQIGHDLAEAIAALYRPGIPGKPESGPAEGTAAPSGAGSTLSDGAIHVLDKLSRKAKFGVCSVGVEALVNMTHMSERELEKAIVELRKRGLLDRDGTGHGGISLNPARSTEIRELAQRIGGK